MLKQSDFNLCSNNDNFSFLSEAPGKALRDALKEGVLPLDRILLESDAPYMIPNALEKDLDSFCKALLKRCQPGRNEPCTLPIVAHTVAKCLGVDAEEVARASTENARRVFDLKPPICNTVVSNTSAPSLGVKSE